MIVRPAGDGVHLITQPEHARLAARIMEHCVALAAHPRRATILRAIAEHDNGWTDADAVPSVDATSGAVIDVVAAPLHVRHGAWPIAIAGLSDDPLAAALVAHHAAFVYARFRPDAEWRQFFVDMEAARERRLHAARAAFEDLLADYAFVRLGDLISLAFCTARTEEQRFGGWTIRLSGARVNVTPGLFGGAPIPIAIAARELPRAVFESDADLRAALRDAPTVAIRGEVA